MDVSTSYRTMFRSNPCCETIEKVIASQGFPEEPIVKVEQCPYLSDNTLLLKAHLPEHVY